MPDPARFLTGLVARLHDPAVPRTQRKAITSVCSAHPLVLEAALRQAVRNDRVVLIEATCNQVNHEGGYTGLTPADFRDRVLQIAEKAGCPEERIILGGDHLGPAPWVHLPAEEAMARAGDMITAFAAAGFTKLHLDASMGCAGEPAALPDETVAERAVLLASRAEAASPAHPVYVVGTEVPVPGGAAEHLTHVTPTAAGDARRTLEITQAAFNRALPPQVWERVIALVVQPGVEFDAEHTVFYEPDKARALCGVLMDTPGLAFEAHSTDYQPVPALRHLVEDGFAILKVGPALTFALREALYGLDALASVLRPERQSLRDVMEAEMLAHPAYWQKHYDPERAAILRHYSFSDRIRYYWTRPAAQTAVKDLCDILDETGLPDPLLSQFLPRLYERVRVGQIPRKARELIIVSIMDVLEDYNLACGEPTSSP